MCKDLTMNPFCFAFSPYSQPIIFLLSFLVHHIRVEYKWNNGNEPANAQIASFDLLTTLSCHLSLSIPSIKSFGEYLIFSRYITHLTPRHA